MNFREIAIISALESLSSEVGAGGFYALEIGCMFGDEQGLSTFHIARFIKNIPGEKAFFSIECNKKNIFAAGEWMDAREPGLSGEISFVEGWSLDVLPELLEKIPHIDFAFLDGGGHPEICLREFEMIVSKLSPGGVIVMDDFHEFDPNHRYPFKRPFGKGTLIYPLLVMADYLKVRDQHEGADSPVVSRLKEDPWLLELSRRDYLLLASDQYKMLFFGDSRIVSDCYRIFTEKKFEDFKKSNKQVTVLDKYGMASQLKRAGNLREAGELFESLLTDNAVNSKILAGVYFHLGEIDIFQDKYERAKVFFRECLQLNPHHRKAGKYFDFLKGVE
jgi:hypothetical protein